MSGGLFAYQGVLNRVRAALIVTGNTGLNVGAGYLGKAGISVTPNGKITDTIENLTGLTQSPSPYITVDVTIHLLKTQALAAAWRSQYESYSAIGNITLIPDADPWPNYTFLNAAITHFDNMPFDGMDAGHIIHLFAYYPLNNSLWNMP